MVIHNDRRRDIFLKEVLGGSWNDSQAEHFLRGDVGVDADAIAHETMIVNGKVTDVLWAVPGATSRSAEFHLSSGTREMVADFRILRGTHRTLCLCRSGGNRIAFLDPRFSSRSRNWIGNACMIGFALGSPLLLLLGNLSIYDEAIIWGFAWSVAALYFLCRSRTAEGAALTRSLLGFSFCAGAALLSRATFGAPFVLIAPLLAIRLFRRQPIRNMIALLLPLGVALIFYLFLATRGSVTLAA